MIRRTAIILAGASTLMLANASAASSLVVRGAWSWPATVTAVLYATIVNDAGSSDRLIGASSPDARRVEMHESTASVMPMGSMNGMPMHGEMMSMTSLAAIRIPAHGTRMLAPGGYHLMLVDLRHALKAGDTVPLRFHFARAGWISVSATVRGT